MRCVYLAGPITGLTFRGASRWRAEFTEALKRANESHRYPRTTHLHPLSPMRDKDQFICDPRQVLPSTWDEGKAAVHRDLLDIRRSDAVLVNLLGASRVSLGTMCELGYAYAERKFILVVMEPDNPHDHVFVTELASQIVPTLDDALRVLGAL